MKPTRAENNTFVVHLTGQSHASWQGSISWVNQQRTASFRSTLELLRLIDSTLPNNVEELLDNQQTMQERTTCKRANQSKGWDAKL